VSRAVTELLCRFGSQSMPLSDGGVSIEVVVDYLIPSVLPQYRSSYKIPSSSVD
jgi:hypothetical protein